jgi:15-cis-phytoene synthase
MIQLFHESSEACSSIVTKKYSTSFASAINLLDKSIRQPIYNIYGFVRFADEIVDTFHAHDKSRNLRSYST